MPDLIGIVVNCLPRTLRGFLILWNLIVFILPAHADDLVPPAWRGESMSTFQQWEFEFEGAKSKTGRNCLLNSGLETQSGYGGAPEFIENPYEKKTGICAEFKSLWAISPNLDWSNKHSGRTGIWHLKNDRSKLVFLNFTIPNAGPLSDAENEIQVQLTYQSRIGTPNVQVQYFLEKESSELAVNEPVNEYLESHLPNSWQHRVYSFKIIGCPKYEMVHVVPPERDDVYIDEVVIDTICRVDPINNSK